MPKEIFVGAKDLLKPVAYTWWPPEEYASQLLGRFDLYPEEHAKTSRDKIMSTVEQNQVTKQPEYK